MFYTDNILRILKYFLFGTLTLSPLCFAAVETVQRWGDDRDKIYYFSTKSPYIWNRDFTDRPNYEYKGSGDQALFFYILAIGLVLFLVLIGYCLKSTANSSASSTSTNTTVHPPPSNPANTRRMPNETGVRVVFNNTAYSSSAQLHVGRNETDYGGRPPDYAAVTLNDLGKQTTDFPPVVNKSHETPPPKYDESAIFN